MEGEVKKVVLAYSGGLDTSIIVKWLKNEFGCEVIAFTADIGQAEELDYLEEKAISTGASKVYIEDLREEFVRDFVFTALKANAVYEGTYLLGTSIARPLIAKRQIEIAQMEGADAVAHGSTGKGNDQVRFELTYYALNPYVRIISPWREWQFQSREELMAYARENGISIPVTKEKPYSSDRNLLHISFEGGILEDPWSEPPEDMFILSVSPEKAPDRPTVVEIDFEDGIPKRVDGQALSPANLLARLNELGGKNGVGRVDMVENRYVGMKSRGVYETPGGTILHIAHRAVESMTMDREVMHLRDSLIPKISELIYNGYWFSPEMEVLKVALDEMQKNVTGTVRVKLYKGNCTVIGRKSEKSL
ncbi:MAG: argininosuccinate synthase, partial [Deltaproteobacteria bacterium]|nr:argininosuccinate synthase [Deltaproteobacteria bacterium]